MRTTIDVDEALLAQARAYAPGLTKTALVEAGLRALVKQQAARELAEMGGTQPELKVPPRRKVS